MLLFLFWIIGIILIVLQTTLLQTFSFETGTPDLVFILVAFIGYRFAWIPGIILAFSIGWIMDVVAGIHLGFYPLLCLLTFASLKVLTSNSPVRESMYQIPLVGISFFLIQMFFYFVYSLTLPEVLPEWSWGLTTRRTVLVMVASMPLFLLFNALFEFVQKRRLRSRPLRRRSRESL
jgi:rod shape-determining protein MreD